MAEFNATIQLGIRAPSQAQLNSAVKAMERGIGAINVPVNVSKKVTSQINGLTNATQKATRETKHFGDAVALAGKRFVAYSAATALIIRFSNAVSKATTNAIRFGKEVAKLKQTFDEEFIGKTEIDNVLKISKNYGLATVKVAELVRVLGQAGQTFKEATKNAELLAQTSLLASFDDVSESLEGMISLMATFNLDARQTKVAFEQINQVSKKYAVESNDLVSGIKRAGGVFEATGGNVTQLITLLAKVRSTTRESADAIATGFRTIFARLERPKTIEFLRQFNIELEKGGQFIGPFEAVQAISKGIEAKGIKSTSIEFARIVEQIGGIRQLSRVIPLITNASKTQEIYNEALAASGTIAKDVEKAQQSLAFKIDRFRQNLNALFIELSQNEGLKALGSGLIGVANAIVETTRALKDFIPLIGIVAGIGLGRAVYRGARKTNLLSFEGVFGFNSGGAVPGRGNTDNVSALLTPGEFVINKKSAQAYGYDKLKKINKYAKGGKVERFAKGGGPPDIPKEAEIRIREIGKQLAAKNVKPDKEYEDLVKALRDEAKSAEDLNDINEEVVALSRKKVKLLKGEVVAPQTPIRTTPTGFRRSSIDKTRQELISGKRGSGRLSPTPNSIAEFSDIPESPVLSPKERYYAERSAERGRKRALNRAAEAHQKQRVGYPNSIPLRQSSFLPLPVLNNEGPVPLTTVPTKNTTFLSANPSAIRNSGTKSSKQVSKENQAASNLFAALSSSGGILQKTTSQKGFPSQLSSSGSSSSVTDNYFKIVENNAKAQAESLSKFKGSVDSAKGSISKFTEVLIGAELGKALADQVIDYVILDKELNSYAKLLTTAGARVAQFSAALPALLNSAEAVSNGFTLLSSRFGKGGGFLKTIVGFAASLNPLTVALAVLTGVVGATTAAYSNLKSALLAEAKASIETGDFKNARAKTIEASGVAAEGTNYSTYISDSIYKAFGYKTYQEELQGQLTDINKQEEDYKKNAQNEQARKAASQIEYKLNLDLIDSLAKLKVAVDKAESIGRLGDLATNLASGNFRGSAFSSGLTQGNKGAIALYGEKTGDVRGANALANEASVLEKLDKEINQYLSGGRGSTTAERGKAAGSFLTRLQGQGLDPNGNLSADLLAGDDEAIKSALDSMKEAYKKRAEQAIELAQKEEAAFGQYLDSVSRAANAENELKNNLLSFAQSLRDNQEEQESFRVGGNAREGIRSRRGTFNLPSAQESAARRAGLISTSSTLASARVQRVGIEAGGGTTNVKALQGLENTISGLEIVSQQQIQSIQRENEQRKLLIENIKQEIALEKSRAETIDSLLLKGAGGDVDARRQTSQAFRIANQLQQGGGTAESYRTAARQLQNSDLSVSIDEILNLAGEVGTQARQAARAQAALQFGGQVNGPLREDIFSVGATGATVRGNQLSEEVGKQRGAIRDNEATLLKTQELNLQALQETTQLFSKTLVNMDNSLQGFVTQLNTAISSISNADIKLTMGPANVVVTLNTGAGLELLSQQVIQNVKEEVARQIMGKEWGK